jgi:hypothetical protein
MNKCKECDSDHVKLPLPIDMGNDEKEGKMTEISKQPRCDHRDLMKERLTFWINQGSYLRLSVATKMIGKKRRLRPFLHVNSLDCHSKGLISEIRQKWA